MFFCFLRYSWMFMEGTITSSNAWMLRGVFPAELSVSGFTVVCYMMLLNIYEWINTSLYICHVIVFFRLRFYGQLCSQMRVWSQTNKTINTFKVADLFTNNLQNCVINSHCQPNSHVIAMRQSAPPVIPT